MVVVVVVAAAAVAAVAAAAASVASVCDQGSSHPAATATLMLLVTQGLSQALAMGQREFTQEELDGWNVSNVHMDHYMESETVGSCFRPVYTFKTLPDFNQFATWEANFDRCVLHE